MGKRKAVTLADVKEEYINILTNASLFGIRYRYLPAMMARQTPIEQNTGRTIERNEIGFNHPHAKKIERINRQYNRIVETHPEVLRKAYASVLVHYWKQFAIMDGVLDENGRVVE